MLNTDRYTTLEVSRLLDMLKDKFYLEGHIQ
jgi:hypothetical protein